MFPGIPGISREYFLIIKPLKVCQRVYKSGSSTLHWLWDALLCNFYWKFLLSQLLSLRIVPSCSPVSPSTIHSQKWSPVSSSTIQNNHAKRTKTIHFLADRKKSLKTHNLDMNSGGKKGKNTPQKVVLIVLQYFPGPEHKNPGKREF